MELQALTPNVQHHLDAQKIDTASSKFDTTPCMPSSFCHNTSNFRRVNVAVLR